MRTISSLIQNRTHVSTSNMFLLKFDTKLENSNMSEKLFTSIPGPYGWPFIGFRMVIVGHPDDVVYVLLVKEF